MFRHCDFRFGELNNFALFQYLSLCLGHFGLEGFDASETLFELLADCCNWVFGIRRGGVGIWWACIWVIGCIVSPEQRPPAEGMSRAGQQTFPEPRAGEPPDEVGDGDNLGIEQPEAETPAPAESPGTE